jgi:hypothetical protein
MAAEYPHHFTGHEGNEQERLFDLLMAGNPEPMSEDDAYEQAFEHLMEHKPQKAAATTGDDWNDPVPFSAEHAPAGGLRRLSNDQHRSACHAARIHRRALQP